MQLEQKAIVVKETPSFTEKKNALGQVPFLAICLTAVACIVVLATWFYFDHKLPGIDESGHILNSLEAKELFTHPKFWKPTWWHSLLTINGFYPPFVYIFNGIIKVIFGDSSLSDAMSLIIFDLIMSTSLGLSLWLMTKNKMTSCLAIVILHLYPQISYLSHYPLLDFPLEAMIALGFLSLLWWASNMTRKSSTICGLCLTLACLTKQIAVAYLCPAAVYLILNKLRTSTPPQRTSIIQNSIITALPCVASLALWYCLNRSFLSEMAVTNKAVLASQALQPTFQTNLIYYSEGMINNMSPLLTVLLLCSICFAHHHIKQLSPIIFAGIIGLSIISGITWTPPLDRYSAPLLLTTAALSACGVSKLFSKIKHPAILASLIAITSLSIGQYLSFNFAPTPMNLGRAGNNLSNSLGCVLRFYRGELLHNDAPHPQENWGQAWAIDLINSNNPEAQDWLNILANHPNINTHTMELMVKRKKCNIKPTTSREWTLLGDKVSFDEIKASYYKWYLIKIGNEGNQLLDSQSENNYSKLKTYISKSGNFTCTGSLMLPDKSFLKLYKRNN